MKSSKYYVESKIYKAPLYCNLPHPDVIFNKSPDPSNLPNPYELLKKNENVDLKATEELKRLLNIK